MKGSSLLFTHVDLFLQFHRTLGLAAVYTDLAREQEARAEASEVLRINPKFSVKKYAKRLPNTGKGSIERHINALRKAGLPN